MAASTASHRPIKGILKNKSSTTSTVLSSAEPADRSVTEELNRDTVNILAPYHPADQDYGVLELQEPSAADHRRAGLDAAAAAAGSDSEPGPAGPPALSAQKLAAAKGSEIKFRVNDLESSGDEDSDLSPEEREKKRQFEIKRKLHYNEGLNIKLARELISKDLNEEEEEEEEEGEEGEEGEEQREEGGAEIDKTSGGNVSTGESSQGSSSDQLKSQSQSS